MSDQDRAMADTPDLDELWQQHEKGCALCHYDIGQYCIAAILMAEVERLRRFASEARALALSGDCDYCGATDRLLDLVDKYGITKETS